MKVTGIERVDYISKKSGNRVSGYNIYCSSPIKDDRGFGEKVEQFYISDFYASKITDIFTSDIIGMDVDFTYNRYGNITSVFVL